MTVRISLSGANRKTSIVEVREPLNATERTRLLVQLAAKRGVCSARFTVDDPQRLRIEYDADVVSALGILDFFETYALHARVLLRQERTLTSPLPATVYTALQSVGP